MAPKRNPKKTEKESSKKAAEGSGSVLNRDVLEPILARLPVKSLLRCRCVSGPWKSIISKPRMFIDNFSKTPTASSLQSHLIACPLLGISQNLTPVLSDKIFLDSCNGLVFMARPSLTDQILLWNPATRRSKFLPHSATTSRGAKLVSLGFGCSASGDDFKVVRIIRFEGRRAFVEVYSSKEDSWITKDQVGVGFRFALLFRPKHDVIANGNPYWDYLSTSLLGFDATRMEFQIVDTPPLLYDPKLVYVEWEGSLAALRCVKKDYDWLEAIHIWVYNADEKQWARRYTFGGIDLHVDECLACSKSGKIVLRDVANNVFIFDPEMGLSELKKYRKRYLQMFAYNESLACVEGMEAVVVRKTNKEENAEFDDNIHGFLVYAFNYWSGDLEYYYKMVLS